MDQGRIERSAWIPASRERVWQAIADPEQLAQWLLPPMLGAQMRRDAGDTLYVCMGPMEIPVAIVEALDAPRQLTSCSLPERQLRTTYTLDDENGGTRVVVALHGFEALPADTRQDRVEPTLAGWERGLANLQAHVAGEQLPYPEGYVAAMFGYRRVTPRVYAIERSIWIAAPPARVWRAITDPEQIAQWFSPGTSWDMTKLAVGGRLFVRDAESGAELYPQEITLLDEPHQLALRSIVDPPETPKLSLYTLREEAAGTRLTITHSGYELDPEGAREPAMEQNAFGFGMMLGNIKAVVEGLPLPTPGGF